MALSIKFLLIFNAERAKKRGGRGGAKAQFLLRLLGDFAVKKTRCNALRLSRRPIDRRRTASFAPPALASAALNRSGALPDRAFGAKAETVLAWSIWFINPVDSNT